MHTWVPWISMHFPGSGITPFSVWDLPLEWWRNYKARTRAILEAQAKAHEQAQRKGRR